mmetsp:Transcript_1157/g.1787  ORF Transcript_1157/g.1787 Transcript_1157/m.1787 type:complete len:109 (+) Transcript_1157:33-359(+)
MLSKILSFVLLVVALVSNVTAFVPSTSYVATNVAASTSTALKSSPLIETCTMQSSTELINQLPTQLLSLEVQFGAYLAVLLGTFVPVSFLIILYIQSESRKAGERSAK